MDGRTRSRNVKSDHHNFPCKKKRKRKWKELGVIIPTACVHVSERFTSDGSMDMFIPTCVTLSQPSDIDRNISTLVENNHVTAMLVKGPKTWVKTLLDSGCNCSIFTDISMFKDYNVYRVPIQTAGGTIYSHGHGTVGHLQNCLNMNLLSTHHVTQYIVDIGIEFQRNI